VVLNTRATGVAALFMGLRVLMLHPAYPESIPMMAEGAARLALLPAVIVSTD